MSDSFPLTLIDARGVEAALSEVPRRLVSLVPSQTELLAHLGLEREVAGLTRFCVHPSGWKAEKEIVGGTKNVNVETVEALRPDLILANREENTRADVEALEGIAPVFVTDVATVPEAGVMIRAVGRLTGRLEKAAALADEIDAAFAALPAFAPLRAAYLIWRAPYMTVGRGTIIHDVMRRGGLVNVFGRQTRYPEVMLEALAAAEPDLVLLSTEPFPFQEKHVEELRPALPGVPIRLVDGEPFSWYGPRLLQTPGYLRTLREAFAAEET